jgi:uncharacterized membrane protein
MLPAVEKIVVVVFAVFVAVVVSGHTLVRAAVVVGVVGQVAS